LLHNCLNKLICSTVVVLASNKHRKDCPRLDTNLFRSDPYYQIPNLPLLVGFAESGMVEKMRAQAARWDTHGRAWVICGISNPTRIRQQCSVKWVNDSLFENEIHVLQFPLLSSKPRTRSRTICRFAPSGQTCSSSSHTRGRCGTIRNSTRSHGKSIPPKARAGQAARRVSN